QMPRDWPPAEEVNRGEFCVLTSAAHMVECLGRSEGNLPPLLRAATSVYVYGFQQTDACRNLLRLLTGDKNGDICNLRMPEDLISVTRELPELCGPMSGITVRVKPAEHDTAFNCQPAGDGVQRIITAVDGPIFLGVTCGGVR